MRLPIFALVRGQIDPLAEEVACHPNVLQLLPPVWAKPTRIHPKECNRTESPPPITCAEDELTRVPMGSNFAPSAGASSHAAPATFIPGAPSCQLFLPFRLPLPAFAVGTEGGHEAAE